MKLKRIISVILVVMMTATMLTIGSFSSSAASTPTKFELAAHELDNNYRYNGDDLGATYTKEGTTFKVWAPTGTNCTVNLYTTGTDQEEGAEKLGSYPLTKDEATGIFTTTVPGDLKNVYYTYTISATSIVGGEAITKETTDVYSVAAGANGQRSMICDLDSTDPEGWDQDKHVITKDITDASVWEIHVKDFSYSESSGVSAKNRGKYLAFTEEGTTLNGEGDVSTCIDYLKELGITYVQLNPIYDFGSVDETGSDSQFNWGYDPMNYNVPEGSYSSNPYDGNTRIKELKQMIQALHKAGIGIIMDVVYNHTYNTNTSFQACVPDYYYRKSNAGSFSSGSGCGNDTASERAMFRNFMIQSTKYWAEEYHIDGFRFDLMGLHDVETMNQVRKSLDTIDKGMIMYGEGWAMSTVCDLTDCDGNTTKQAAQNATRYLDTRIGMFNDQFRDGMKGSFNSGAATGFVQGSASGNSTAVKYGLRANAVGGAAAWKAYAPTQCVNYVSCHDNNTLYDKFVMSVTPNSKDFRARNEEIVKINKFAQTISAVSQGIHFMLAGEEMGRSKDGDENSYKSAPTENMIDWNNLVQYNDLVSYYKGMMEIRKAFEPFTADSTTVSANQYVFGSGLTVSDPAFGVLVKNTVEGQWNKVALVFNSSRVQSNVVSLAFDKEANPNTEWVVVADGKEAGVKAIRTIKGTDITVPSSTAMVLVEKSTFDAVARQTNKSKVKVIARDAETNKVLSERVLYGTIGSGYKTEADKSVGLEYVLDSVKGETSGKFTEETKTIEYLYARYVPDSLKQTVSGADKMTVKEVTLLQKYLADEATLTPEQIAIADYNGDKNVDINDAKMIQKFIMHDNYGAINTLKIKYLSDRTKKEIAPAKSVDVMAGQSGTYEPIKIVGYKYSYNSVSNTDASATIDFDFNSKLLIFYYDDDNYDVTLHVKLSNAGVYSSPALWAWHDAGDIYGTVGWPGKKLTNPDSNGWYTETFTIPNGATYSMIISSNGTKQTKDYTGFTEKELWAVVNTPAAVQGGDYVKFYDSNPES